LAFSISGSDLLGFGALRSPIDSPGFHLYGRPGEPLGKSAVRVYTLSAGFLGRLATTCPYTSIVNELNMCPTNSRPPDKADFAISRRMEH
jgi:hypothetical protein